MSHTPTHHRPPADPPARTLWEEGRTAGRVVVTRSVLATLAVGALNVGLVEELSLFYDLTFVVICLVAALGVHPRDFFPVGVLPPLLMLAVVAVLAAIDTSWVAEPTDGLVQAVVSGLAHHAGALIAGLGLVLGVLALRQVALRNSGRLRNAGRLRTSA